MRAPPLHPTHELRLILEKWDLQAEVLYPTEVKITKATVLTHTTILYRAPVYGSHVVARKLQAN